MITALLFACATLGVLAVAAWACDRMGDRRDGLEQERRRQQAIRRCVLRVRGETAVIGEVPAEIAADLESWDPTRGRKG